MAERTDITIRPELSPRLIIVDAPSLSLDLQDLHDTIAAWQDRPPNHVYDVMIDSAGKEALGGGVLVGITSTLLNAQVMFEARTAVYASGTATAADPIGQVLTAAGATFTGTPRGSLLVNVTDGSRATVLEVLSATSIRVDDLAGGTGDDFEIGDAYQIFEMFRPTISGGNLVAVDDVGADLDPLAPSFGVSTDRAASSSATISEIQDVRNLLNAILGNVV